MRDTDFKWGLRYLTPGPSPWSALRVFRTLDEAIGNFFKTADYPGIQIVRLYDLRNERYPKLDEYVIEYDPSKDPRPTAQQLKTLGRPSLYLVKNPRLKAKLKRQENPPRLGRIQQEVLHQAQERPGSTVAEEKYIKAAEALMKKGLLEPRERTWHKRLITPELGYHHFQIIEIVPAKKTNPLTLTKGEFREIGKRIVQYAQEEGWSGPPVDSYQDGPFVELEKETNPQSKMTDRIVLRTWGPDAWRSTDYRWQIVRKPMRTGFDIIDTHSDWKQWASSPQVAFNLLSRHTGKRVLEGDDWEAPERSDNPKKKPDKHHYSVDMKYDFEWQHVATIRTTSAKDAIAAVKADAKRTGWSIPKGTKWRAVKVEERKPSNKKKPRRRSKNPQEANPKLKAKLLR